jgi:DNA polymerase-3 subunit epsilon
MTIACAIDLETTGLKQSEGHRIIEFGAILYELETKRLLGKYIQRINPQRPIDTKAQAVHGISFEDVANMPTLEEVAPKIIKVMNAADFFIAHNGEGFDIPFIRNELLRIGLNVDQKPLVDTMLSGRWATGMGKSPNLGELCFATGVPYDTSLAHGAEYDIKVMADAFFVGYDKGFFNYKQYEVPHE